MADVTTLRQYVRCAMLSISQHVKVSDTIIFEVTEEDRRHLFPDVLTIRIF